eukprot:1158603-Pelagomonas_calceolata.AAC.6
MACSPIGAVCACVSKAAAVAMPRGRHLGANERWAGLSDSRVGEEAIRSKLRPNERACGVRVVSEGGKLLWERAGWKRWGKAENHALEVAPAAAAAAVDRPCEFAACADLPAACLDHPAARASNRSAACVDLPAPSVDFPAACVDLPPAAAAQAASPACHGAAAAAAAAAPHKKHSLLPPHPPHLPRSLLAGVAAAARARV